MKHCVVDLYLWASRFFVEPTYGELDIFVTVGSLVYVDQSLVVFRSKNWVLEDAYCYIDCFRALPGPKNYLPAATSPRCDESLQVFQTAGDAFQEKPSKSCNDLYT
ncbi:hypothetical protein DPMN_084538 [Dreissena polymorpha]|uniref:Uncharacterized protein n=1 Tax=Dreissena polymorpha TaxID=45954 RepID=A0A9D3YAY6_DREPO|nr:hypothetical protein DPMN_084538 [Dreissena polymorpha]